MTILVSGASGFIGRVLCLQLRKKGYKVRALLNTETEGPWDETINCKLGDGSVPPDTMSSVESIYHLAGVAHTRGASKNLYRKVNLEGTQALMDAAVKASVTRFIFFSSVKAVSEPPSDKCVDESWSEWPKDAYGVSKREAEELILQMADKVGMHAVVIRPTLVYGPCVKGNLQKIMQLVASGWCPPLPDTKNRRSMVHVKDLCSLAMLACHDEKAAGRVYIAADKWPVSTRALYEGICKELYHRIPRWSVPERVFRLAGALGSTIGSLLRRPSPIDTETVSRLLDSACYSSQRAMDELGWQPSYDLLSTIPEMVAAWKMENSTH